MTPEGAAASPIVRPYHRGDREGVRRVYADTAFLGEPVEAYFDDRNLFADLGVSAYVDHFPDYAFVAADGAEVAGYIVGCPSGDAGVRRHALRALPPILGRALTGRYRIGRKTLAYVLDNARAGLRGELLEVNDPAYPANLHINLDARYRGHGLGTALMHAYLDRLRQRGIEGVHLVTTDRNEAAVRLYTRFGFRLLQEKRTRVWQRHLPGEVRLLAFGLRLSD